MKTFILCITLFSISLRCICNKYMHLFDSYLLFQFCLEPLISDSVNSSHSRLLSIPLIKLILFADVILSALRTSCISGYSFTLLSPHVCTHTCAHIRAHTYVSGFGQLISPINITLLYVFFKEVFPVTPIPLSN